MGFLSDRIAAERAVDAFVQNDSVIGLGHGTMVREVHYYRHFPSRIEQPCTKRRMQAVSIG